MDYYLEIKILPDPEFKNSTLMNALFSKLHRALGQVGQGAIGVSFPGFDKKGLGSLLRVHGTEQKLGQLMEANWLVGMRDNTSISALSPVPDSAQHRTVSRIQAKSAHNKRKRSIAKGWLTEQEAFEKIPDSQQKELSLPYAQLKSLSNKNPMRVYIQHGPLLDEPVSGPFSSYGLSGTATVPWWF